MEAGTPTPAAPAPVGAEKATGPVVAALYGLGIGVFVLGLLTTLAEASTGVHDFLEFSSRVGPLSGKTILAVIAFVVSWMIGAAALKDKSPALDKAAKVTAVLVVLGLIGTFPPFFQLFASE